MNVYSSINCSSRLKDSYELFGLKLSDYSILELISYWLQELILFPIRVILWMVKGIERIKKDI